MSDKQTVTVTLPAANQIAMARLFDAPRHLVFEALTTPEFVKGWLLGPPGWSMPVCEIDLRVGGSFRYVWRQNDSGKTMGVRGTYRQIEAPARIVHTEQFDEPWYEGEALCEMTLSETNGKTQMTTVMTYDSQDVRDAVLKSGMIRGVNASYDLLDDLLQRRRLDTNHRLIDKGNIMIDTPRIVETNLQPAATIHLTVPREQMQNVMGPAIKEVMAAVAAQSARPVGPLFSHHLRMPGDTFDFEVGVPVAKPVSTSGRMMPSQLPAARIARTIYRGPYEGLGEAWGELNRWIESQGLKAGATLWESYAAGPESGDDPAKWETELNRPLLD